MVLKDRNVRLLLEENMLHKPKDEGRMSGRADTVGPVSF